MLNPFRQIILFLCSIIIWFCHNSVYWILVCDDFKVLCPVFLILADIPFWCCCHYRFGPFHVFWVCNDFWNEQATASSIYQILEWFGEFIFLCNSLFSNDVKASRYTFGIADAFFDSALSIHSIPLSDSINGAYQFFVKLIVEWLRIFWIMHWWVEWLHAVVVPWFFDIVVFLDNDILFVQFCVRFNLCHDSCLQGVRNILWATKNIANRKPVFSSSFVVSFAGNGVFLFTVLIFHFYLLWMFVDELVGCQHHVDINPCSFVFLLERRYTCTHPWDSIVNKWDLVNTLVCFFTIDHSQRQDLFSFQIYVSKPFFLDEHITSLYWFILGQPDSLHFSLEYKKFFPLFISINFVKIKCMRKWPVEINLRKHLQLFFCVNLDLSLLPPGFELAYDIEMFNSSFLMF